MKGWYGNSQKHALASKGIKSNEYLDRPMGSVEVTPEFGRLRRIIKKQLDKEIKDYGINPDDYKFSFFFVDEDNIIAQAEYKHNYKDITITASGIWYDEDTGEILQRDIITLG